MNLAKIMIPKVSTVFLKESYTVRQGWEIMSRNGYTAIPVINADGQYTGSVSEGDFLKFVMAAGTTDARYMEQFRVAGLVRKDFCPPLQIDADREQVVESILNQNFVPIVDGRNTLCGIVTRRGIIQYLAEEGYGSHMELIVAVYDDWGIGREGTQPLTLSADRKFFRETTRGAAVIAGRRTIEDFPGRKPLPGRENLVLTHSEQEIPGFTVCNTVAQALALAEKSPRTFVIGGGSVYRQLLPHCSAAYVTKVHTTVPCDTYFPDLDQNPDWRLAQVLQTGEENGIGYEMLLYKRIVNKNT